MPLRGGFGGGFAFFARETFFACFAMSSPMLTLDNLRITIFTWQSMGVVIPTIRSSGVLAARRKERAAERPPALGPVAQRRRGAGGADLADVSRRRRLRRGQD
jgi:hypothetical protein